MKIKTIASASVTESNAYILKQKKNKKSLIPPNAHQIQTSQLKRIKYYIGIFTPALHQEFNKSLGLG